MSEWQKMDLNFIIVIRSRPLLTSINFGQFLTLLPSIITLFIAKALVPSSQNLWPPLRPWRHIRTTPFFRSNLQICFRTELFETVKNAPEEKILITHGTDTLIESAQYLQSKFQTGLLPKKKILLTGSFLPQVFKGRSIKFENIYFFN